MESRGSSCDSMDLSKETHGPFHGCNSVALAVVFCMTRLRVNRADFPWTDAENHGTPEASMKSHGSPRPSRQTWCFHGTPWRSAGPHGGPWRAMGEFQGVSSSIPRPTAEVHGNPWKLHGGPLRSSMEGLHGIDNVVLPASISLNVASKRTYLCLLVSPGRLLVNPLTSPHLTSPHYHH